MRGHGALARYTRARRHGVLENVEVPAGGAVSFLPPHSHLAAPAEGLPAFPAPLREPEPPSRTRDPGREAPQQAQDSGKRQRRNPSLPVAQELRASPHPLQSLQDLLTRIVGIHRLPLPFASRRRKES